MNASNRAGLTRGLTVTALLHPSETLDSVARGAMAALTRAGWFATGTDDGSMPHRLRMALRNAVAMLTPCASAAARSMGTRDAGTLMRMRTNPPADVNGRGHDSTTDAPRLRTPSTSARTDGHGWRIICA
jgi:hypothetical protein